MKFFKEFKKGMTMFGDNLAIIVNTVLLSIVYVVGVGVSAIFIRISKKRLIDTRLSGKKTYWTRLDLKKRQIDEYYRQF